MSKFVRLSFALLALTPMMLQAQGPWSDPPRVEDHYWRRRVLMRIDMREKINKPLIPSYIQMSNESNIYAPSTSQFGNRAGIVKSLLDGLKDLKYTGFVPDSLDAPRTYDDVYRMLNEIEGGAQPATPAGGAGQTAAPAEDDGGGFGDDDGGGFGGDDFGDIGGGDDAGAGASTGPATAQDAAKFDEILAGMNTVLEFVEDRIFDKNKSDMYYDIHYIRLYWVDPQGQLMERPIVAFRYDDIKDILDDTQWRNFYNDAEFRSLREVFELRLFHGVIANVSGSKSLTLEEAEKRRQQMIEFEHHLWQY